MCSCTATFQISPTAAYVRLFPHGDLCMDVLTGVYYRYQRNGGGLGVIDGRDTCASQGNRAGARSPEAG